MRPGEYRRYDQLADQIKENKCSSIIEIGTCKGVTALEMINASPNIKDCCYYGFDLFEDLTEEILIKEKSKHSETQWKVRSKLQQTGANVCLYKGFTTNTLPEFIKLNVVPDFVFIDGGHSFETVHHDWLQIEKIMAFNTIVIFDDFISPFGEDSTWGCNKTIETIDKTKYKIEILPVTDNIDNSFNINLAKVTKLLT